MDEEGEENVLSLMHHHQKNLQLQGQLRSGHYKMPCKFVDVGNFTERETWPWTDSEGTGARENFETKKDEFIRHSDEAIGAESGSREKRLEA